MSEGEQLLEALRPVSFAIAYRMLSSVSEAEDVVQEALLQLHRALQAGERIESPRAFVATITTRRAIDQLRSARARREQYVGEWLPEPILTDGAGDPAGHAEMADSLSLAMLVLLDSLSPEQRAALLLHDVFDYDYATVAEIIGKSPDNVRQLASRARRHVQEGRPRFPATRDQQEELARRFVAAMEEGDLAGLEALLAQDVVLTGDGGGRAPAPLRPLHGRGVVARTMLRWMEAISGAPGVRLQPTDVNGGVGGVLLDGRDRVVGVWAFEVGHERIRSIKAIVNSQKLAHLGPTAELGSLVSPRGPDDA